MALKPILKLKVDELFLRWLSEPETQTLLRSNLKSIVRGDPVPVGGSGPRLPQSPRAGGESSSSRLEHAIVEKCAGTVYVVAQPAAQHCEIISSPSACEQTSQSGELDMHQKCVVLPTDDNLPVFRKILWTEHF